MPKAQYEAVEFEAGCISHSDSVQAVYRRILGKALCSVAQRLQQF